MPAHKLHSNNFYGGFTAIVRTCVFSLCLFGGCSVFAQEAECKQILKDVYGQYALLFGKNKDKTARFEILITTKGKNVNGDLETKANMVQMKLSAKHYYMKNQHMEIFADQENVYSVLATRKVIFRAANQRKLKTDSLPMMDMDKFYELVEQCTCHKKLKKVGYDTELVFKMKTGEKQSAAKSMVFRIDGKRQLFHSFSMVMANDAPIKEMQVDYLITDFSTKPVWTGTLNSRFKDVKSGQLLPNYKGYKLLETPNKK